MEVKLQREGRVQAACAAVPAARLIPPYKSWAFQARNGRAVQTGLRMFYIDDTGLRPGSLLLPSAVTPAGACLQTCSLILVLPAERPLMSGAFTSRFVLWRPSTTWFFLVLAHHARSSTTQISRFLSHGMPTEQGDGAGK